MEEKGVGFVKRILLMVLILTVSVMSTAFAYSDESNADAQKVFDSIKEIRYNVEAGVNFEDYSSLVSKAIVNYKKYNENHPGTDKDSNITIKLKDLLSDYGDARYLWESAITNDKQVRDSKDVNRLIKYHPAVQEKLFPDKYGYYQYKDILHALWSVAADDEKSLTDTWQK